MPLFSLHSSSCLCIYVPPRLNITLMYFVSLPGRVYLYSFISDFVHFVVPASLHLFTFLRPPPYVPPLAELVLSPAHLRLAAS